MMSDIEAEVAQRAPSEGLEAAVRRVYDRELAKAVGDVEGVAAPLGRAVQIVAFGFAGGLATMGIVGLGGLYGWRGDRSCSRRRIRCPQGAEAPQVIGLGDSQSADRRRMSCVSAQARVPRVSRWHRGSSLQVLSDLLG